MELGLKDRVVIVTGAASGIGKAIDCGSLCKRRRKTRIS